MVQQSATSGIKAAILLNSKYLIYGLVDPRTKEVRYVGKSCSGLRRPQRHKHPSEMASDHTYKGNWIRKLKSLGMDYIITVLEVFGSPEPLAEVERRWIRELRNINGNLTNLTSGGGAVCMAICEALKHAPG